MRRLGDAVARAPAMRRALQSIDPNDKGRLDEMRGFGSNPGALDARVYIPDGLAADAPLVVVLHGCTQSASLYDRGSGWSKLADDHGFALLFPQQRRANNSNLCFNWFVPGDARRGRGEALSISQMVKHMTSRHQLDPSRVFVTGLSAGGAMTAVMLATYPELFAGGAIIAGLPFATADTLPEALERMRGQGTPSRRELGARLRAAAPAQPHRPTLSVWHGTRDTIVDSSNAGAIVDQWRDGHDLGSAPGTIETVDGHRHEIWRDSKGRVAVERYDVKGMGHGVPLDMRGGDPCGIAGPHMLDSNICSTRTIAGSWGLTGKKARLVGRPRAAVAHAPSGAPVRAKAGRSSPSDGVGAVIENALRAAGLLR